MADFFYFYDVKFYSSNFYVFLIVLHFLKHIKCMKKNIFVIFLFIILVCPLFYCYRISYAVDGEIGENYMIYNEKEELICEKSSIEVGDSFITRDFYEYQIIKVDNHKGYAKLIRKLEVPKIKRKDFVSNNKLSQRGELSKKICLYMTHNDESYRPTDGYDSVYGAGGIHDVARYLKNELVKKDIDVVLDETLHIPHNSSAYTRSGVTAKNLLDDERPDAMFDVHRDGVSKSFYYYNDGGKDYSKIRIVVGKSNPNFDENYKFAQSIFAIGNSMYPWLFSDIYCGKGHYNQSLQPTDLLFEMGTYLIEKEYVFNTIPLLVEVIDTTLYASLVDDGGDITIDDNAPATNDNPTTITKPSTDYIDSNTSTNKKNDKGWISAMIISFVFIFLLAIGGYFLFRYGKRKN